jgi:hypothetical protein
MKSIKSMPAIAHRPASAGPGGSGGRGGAGAGGGSGGDRTLLPPAQASMPRSQSMAATTVMSKPQERMRVMARRVPFMAFTGVGSQLVTFGRSFSRANLARLGSRIQSSANLAKMGMHGSASYGSMGEAAAALGPTPSPLDRDYSDVTAVSTGSGFFGNTFADEDEEELEGMQPGFTVALGMAVFTAVLASFQVGYNSGVLNVPQDTIVSALKLSTIQWSFAVAIFCIGGLLGSMSGARMADRLGRKNFLLSNNVLFITGGLLESLSSEIVMLSLGRLAIGVGCGGATVVVPMYLGEIAPANLRGSLGTMNQFAMVSGCNTAAAATATSCNGAVSLAAWF